MNLRLCITLSHNITHKAEKVKPEQCNLRLDKPTLPSFIDTVKTKYE